MKLLICGDWHSEVHEHWLKRAFLKLGHEVSEFRWSKYFNTDDHYINCVLQKIQNKFIFGPILKKINMDH